MKEKWNSESNTYIYLIELKFEALVHNDKLVRTYSVRVMDLSRGLLSLTIVYPTVRFISYF